MGTVNPQDLYYNVLAGDTYEELEDKVNKALSDGATLVGGICTEKVPYGFTQYRFRYLQACVGPFGYSTPRRG